MSIQALRKWLLSGLLVLVPLIITLWVLDWVVTTLDQTLRVLPVAWQPDNWLGVHIPGLGVLFALWLFGRKRGRSFFEVADLIAPCVPTGIAAVRLGNFINGELWGRQAPADLPWAMIFPQAQDGGMARHPSQLYQAAGEGLLLFIILWLYARRPRRQGEVAAAFLTG